MCHFKVTLANEISFHRKMGYRTECANTLNGAFSYQLKNSTNRKEG